MVSGNVTGTPVIDPVRAAESRTAEILAVLTVVHALALISVGLRLFVRTRLIRAFGKDDAVVVLSALFALGGWITFIIQGQHGLGRHQETLSRNDSIIYRQMSFVYSILATDISMCLLKVSIALNLLRFSNGSRWCSRALWGVIIFVCLYSTAYIISQLALCQPITANWIRDPKARCLTSRPDEFRSYGAVNTYLSISTDVALAILPIPIIWTTILELRTRIYLVVILSLGYLAVALGLVKAVYQLRFSFYSDLTYDLSVPFWGFIQINVGIIAACAVSLRPLVSALRRCRSENEALRPSSDVKLLEGRQWATNGTGEYHTPIRETDRQTLELGRWRMYS